MKARLYKIPLPGDAALDFDAQVLMVRCKDMAAFATAVQHAHAQYLLDELKAAKKAKAKR